jgi:hypothetical protein
MKEMIRLQINSIDVVFYSVIFLLPGYIIEEIIKSIMPKKQYSEGINFLRYLAYSIVNLALWSWIYFIINNFILSTTIIYWILLILVTVITSIITGLVLGLVRKKEIIRKAFSNCGVQIEHPIPTAWDYKFSKTQEDRWVIVRLANNEIIYGKYGSKSLASSDDRYRDLYLEEVYVPDIDKEWKISERSDGIWISENEIKSIEFKIGNC